MNAFNDQNIKQLKKILRDLGLGEKEINIYLILLTIGPNPASVISKKIGVNRASCYQFLNKLIDQGFVHEIIQKSVTYFSAVESKYIINQLKEKKNELEEDIHKLQQVAEKIKALTPDYLKKPKVAFYEGNTGIINIVEDTLSNPAGTLLRCYISLEELTATMPEYFKKYYERRTRKKIPVKGIYPATINSWQHKSRDAEEIRESRLVPPEFYFHLDILIYGNKVAIISFKESFGVLIESKDMADAQKRIFDTMWEATKKYDETMTKIFEKMTIKRGALDRTKTPPQKVKN